MTDVMLHLIQARYLTIFGEHYYRYSMLLPNYADGKEKQVDISAHVWGGGWRAF
jgi:hypothetical protein